jgi:hypothetical protein
MHVAVLERRAEGAVGEARAREVILVRIASALRGVTRPELATDLAPYLAADLSAGAYRQLLERGLTALLGAGLVAAERARLKATAAGVAHAVQFLGLTGGLPRLWSELRDVRLLARALGIAALPKRLRALATPEGLSAEIVRKAFALPVTGTLSAPRLRAGLAAVVLERAFGNTIRTELAGAVSPRAGRLLAGRLSLKPRDFGTDRRLIAALAAECVGAPRADLAALRQGVLRTFLAGRDPAPAQPSARARDLSETPAGQARSAASESSQARPDLAGFAAEVRRRAAANAQGWSGNRKAFIAHVWKSLRELCPEWGLSELEFKCMLAEAHRTGAVVLAHCDLKDGQNLQDLKDSALVYKNAVYHFIRVDA